LLDVGDGKLPFLQVEGFHDLICLGSNLGCTVASVSELVNHVFPDLCKNYHQRDWLSSRSILCAKNYDKNVINDELIQHLDGPMTTYLSIDMAVTDSCDTYAAPVEIMNSVEIAGLPPHQLKLKVGAPIIILRSLDAPKVVNGTRCIVVQLTPNVIEAEIAIGSHSGERIFIPRIPIIPSETELSFRMKRLQFPVSLCFSMTINKSQGQTFECVGLNLATPVFSHGQLYVALSRVGSPKHMFIFPGDRFVPNLTRNVVYDEIL
jgi:ATP-dependent DNA helicase PIF1